MEVSTFFTRLLQPAKVAEIVKPADDIEDFDKAWTSVLETLAYPDERQLVRGINTTSVPADLRHIVDALVYESNRTDEHTTGQCLEYFLRNDLLGHLERLCENDKPHGIRSEVLRSINNLVVLLSERFLVHNAVHRPLRRLLRSCVGDEPDDKLSGEARQVGAAAMDTEEDRTEFEGDLVDLMCILCSKMRAYPPLLLIFFHDKGWLRPHPSSGAPDPTHLNATLLRPSSPTPSTATRTSKANQRFEFLLFSYLLKFVHREGRIGDFARAGLLFLFDIAFLSPTDEGGENLSMPSRDGSDPLQDARDALGEFILDGDFAEVMAAGLGAIYSLLPSKLRVPTLAQQAKTDEGISASASGGMHLGASYMDQSSAEEEELPLPSSADPEVRLQLDLLLNLFGFLQDIITRCNSPLHHPTPEGTGNVATSNLLGPAIAESVLDAIQRAFLETVLYPAILECSSRDGSGVAVLTYLEVVFSHLDDGPLLDCVLDYLMDATPSTSHASRRSSGFGLLDTVAASKEYLTDESRFTLKDLILDNLRSGTQEASTAALRLLDTLLREHCGSAVHGILRTIPTSSTRAYGPIHRYDSNEEVPSTPPDLLPSATNSADAHLQEVELYGNLIGRIDPFQTSAEVSAGFGGYLSDVQAELQSDQCYLGRLRSWTEGEDEARPSDHRLHPSDAVIRSVLDALGHFLTSTADANVALTGVIISLAMCPHRSLAGWLLYDLPETRDPWKRRLRRHVTSGSDSDESDDDEATSPLDRKIDIDPFSNAAPVDPPAIYQILKEVSNQIHRFRLDVDEFDRLLAERRQGLLFADHLDEAMNVMLDVEPSFPVFASPSSPTRVTSPPRPARTTSAFGSLKNFLTPKRKPPESANDLFSPSPAPVSLREQASKLTGDSPFKSHYDNVSTLILEASRESPIAAGPWSPARTPVPPIQDKRRPLLLQSDSVFGTPRTPGTPTGDGPELAAESEAERIKHVSLSQVLDNCVILEEFLKELVSVITARRALGVDQVGFM